MFSLIFTFDKCYKRKGITMKISCFQCQFYKVTWDPNNPRGCNAYGFKSKQLPSVVVKQSSGMDCMHFVQKKQEVKR